MEAQSGAEDDVDEGQEAQEDEELHSDEEREQVNLLI